MRIEKGRRILFFVSLIGIVVVTLIMGTTYAYQTLNVEYKREKEETIVEAGKLNITYENTSNINLKNMTFLPDYKTADYTEFTLKTNDTSYDVAYQINLKNLVYSNSFVSENFKYTITKIENEEEYIIGGGDFSSLTGTNINLLFNTSSFRILEKGKDETLRLYIWLKENEDSAFESSSFKGQIEIVSYFSNEINEIVYKTLNIYGNTVILPSEYQAVEYIESTGTQYINTGVKGYLKAFHDIKFNNEYSERNLMGYTSTNAYWGSAENNIYEVNGVKGSVLKSNDRHKVIYETKKDKISTLNIDNQEIIEVSNSPANLDSYSYWLFTLNSYHSYDSKNYLYSCKIYQNESKIRDFIPSYRISDNIIGLYDIVTNVFYENEGTGTFGKGNDLFLDELSFGTFNNENKKYVVPIIDDLGNIYNIILNEPLRKLNDVSDYIDLINGRVVRNIKVVDGNYTVLETPIYENLDNINISNIDVGNITICSDNNVCASNIEIVANK